ncbi:ketosteroid isomerase-like protein [Altererythrobacter atlanticus]|uniref:SnoaL-like domain protein n=1 Tax=Croceibacterium atlanticum TaxID=1267766 RepID=A0A0F7KWD2_9SPHN|nr:DUF4440 domain-containing protein [Croceibacterium atlanticum]AKH43507.1 SnoaL-like domain protein [Croceibacterium atlanticum]MBB5731785.1 ketosteroid isomerase-like protein [Croceibacterium atlanticum]
MKKVSWLSVVSLAPLALLAACGGTAVDPAETVQTVKDTETAQLQSLAAKDVDGVMRYYADDAVIVTPGAAPATGKAAIQNALAGLMEDPNLAVEMQQGEGWAAQSGELAVTTSDGTMTVTDPETGEATVVPMRNQTVWYKATGDTWKIVSEYNVDLTPVSAEAEAMAAE